MKIIFSTDQIYLHGGIEKTLSEKANYFAEVLGYEIIILTTGQQKNLPCYPLSDKIQLIDIGINYVTEYSYFSPLNLKKLFSHFKLQKNILQLHKPDVVIVCNFAFDFYWMPFIHRSSAKLKEYHSSRFFESILRKNAGFVRRVRYTFTDWIESRYDRLIILNKDETTYYKSNNTVIIPNSIPQASHTAPLVSRQVLAAGRIAPVKGFNKLIEAWAMVVVNNTDWLLHIYGEDYLNTQDRLQKMIFEHKLENHVFFKGTSDNLSETMLNYSIFAMSSETECFPLVLLEALSVGLPIVSFDCPTGPRNIVCDHIDGLLANNQDVESLAERLEVLIKNEHQRTEMGRNAKINSHKFFSSNVMHHWQSMFNSLVN